MEGLKVNSQVKEPCHYVVEINVPASEVNTTLNQVTKQYRQQAPIPGFRSGKAPISLVKKRFQEDITSQATSQLMQEALREGLNQAALEPVSMPNFTDKEKKVEATQDQDLVFTIEFDVAPQVELPEYKGLTLERPKVEVTDEMIDEYVDNLRRRHATFDVVDRAAATGDMIKVTYKATIPEGDEVPESARRLIDCADTWLMLSEPEYFPGANEQLVGVSAKEERSFEVTFPEDHREDYLKGKTMPYTFTVHEVHSQQMPELTDELAKTMGAEDVASLREQIKTYITSEIGQSQQSALEGQIYKFLDEQQDFDLPPQLFKMEKLQTLYSMRTQQSRDKDAEEKSEEELETEADTQARQRMKVRYLMEKIAEAEDISVSAQDIRMYVQQFRQYSGLSDAQFQRQYDEEMVAEQGRLSLLSRKVLEKLIDLATIVDKEPAKEDDESADKKSDAKKKTSKAKTKKTKAEE